ncbi:MAG: crossover junction endodeoxyribonuclease RuvC [Paludibacteraceae bacterium]|nr:crossover junction endodeoxyribonuclease RuvC [Paludibacteraceae bacterium]
MQDSVRKEHIILGVDPGTLYMGYALLKTVGQQVDILDFGVLDVHKLEGQYPRLQQEFFFLQDLIEKHHPTCLAIETQFVDKNPQTMIKIVHAQGVAIAAALSKDIPIYEYSPMKIKMAITGNGHSSKEQVAGMLQRFLHIPDEQMPKKLDATDALGIAYCHFLQLGLPVNPDAGAKDWKTYAQRKGLVAKTPSLQGGAQGKPSPAAQLAAALATVKKKKK